MSEQHIDDKIVAEATGNVLQNDITEGCWEPACNQLYFELKDTVHTFCMGLTDILCCIRFAEEKGELPPIDADWWHAVMNRYSGLLEQVFYE